MPVPVRREGALFSAKNGVSVVTPVVDDGAVELRDADETGFKPGALFSAKNGVSVVTPVIDDGAVELRDAEKTGFKPLRPDAAAQACSQPAMLPTKHASVSVWQDLQAPNT